MLTISDSLLRDEEFTKFIASFEGRIWMALWGSVDYSLKSDPDAMEALHKHKKVIVKVSLQKLNKLLGSKSMDKSNVSKALNKLTSKKLIKKFYKDKNINNPVYEVGYISVENNEPVPYAFDVFDRKLIKKSLKNNGLW